MTDVSSIRKANQQKLIWGLICLIVPTVLLIITFIGRPLLHLALSYAGVFDGSFVNPASVIINIILLVVGIVSVISWLPGIVVGIILLATRKPLPKS